MRNAKDLVDRTSRRPGHTQWVLRGGVCFLYVYVEFGFFIMDSRYQRNSLIAFQIAF